MSMKNVIEMIKKNDRFLISSHVNPDPDALCSELALGIFLRSIGKKVSIVNHQTVPGRFHFLPGVRGIKNYWKNRKVNYDVAIIVDCGDLNRIGKVQDLIQKDKVLINIDHHITNDLFGHINLVDPNASSTCEVLYELFLNSGCALSKSLAILLYTGIMTDTGSFRYENTTARTHAIAAVLMEFKFSASQLHRKLYETITFRDLKEFTNVISHFDMHFNKKVACVELRKKILSKFSGEFDLRDTIFKFLRSIKDVEVFVIFTEVGRSKTRVNLRSSSTFDVAKLASLFGGGGHCRASGCTVDQSIPQARKEVLKNIRKAL